MEAGAGVQSSNDDGAPGVRNALARLPEVCELKMLTNENFDLSVNGTHAPGNQGNGNYSNIYVSMGYRMQILW